MNRLKELGRTFTAGLVVENPLLMLMIGLCSALAVTSSVANGLGMGIALTFVLIMSDVIVSAFRKLIPESVRMPIFIIVIASFTTIIDLTMKAYFPALSKSMGVFIPLIVVNCIIMGRVEAFASKNKVLDTAADALGMGLGYTWVMVGISAFRELLGAGTLLGYEVAAKLPGFEPILFFILPPGGFLVFGLFISLNIWLKRVISSRAKARAA
jgi:Na+-translocating ferredoxin:NAD+ oxidoreductase subunit E